VSFVPLCKMTLRWRHLVRRSSRATWTDAFYKTLDEFSHYLSAPVKRSFKARAEHPSRKPVKHLAMNPNVFVPLILAVIAVSLGFSGYYFQLALEQARPILPAPLQDEFAARFALDRFIWSGKAAAPARRSYLRSHLCGCVAFFGMATLVANVDSAPVAIWLFAGVSVFALAVTLRACWRYRGS
jgi:hypothetical protein